MRKNQSIFASFISLFFLTVVFLQPVHQLSHLFQQTQHQHTYIDHNHCSHPGHITEKQHCEFCDFSFSSFSELNFQSFEIIVFSEFIFKPIQLEHKIFVSNPNISYKQLRAPPIYT